MIDFKTKIYAQMLKNGNLQTCEKLIFKTLKLLQSNSAKNYKNIIKSAIVNITPVVEIRQIKKKKRKGLKEFPYVLNKQNRLSLGIKQLKNSSKTKFSKSLFQNIISFSNKKAEILKKKELTQKNHITKKKYAFFRWFY